MSANIYIRRNCNLDLIKLVACIAVIGLHTFMPNVMSLYFLCGFAVPLFFMTSGYFLLNKKEVTSWYVCKKILSIFKIVFCWNLLRYCAVGFIRMIWGYDITNYTLLQFCKELFGSMLQKGEMWQFWYLGTLILLYALLPIFHRVIVKGKVSKILKIPYPMVRLWSILIIISIVLQCASMLLGEPLQKKVIQTFRLWSWLQYFVLGGMMVYVCPKIIAKLSIKVHFLILCISTAFVNVYQYWVGKYIIHTEYAEYFYDSIFTMIWTIILFTWIMRIKVSDKVTPKIFSLCSLTLGVYIIHPSVIQLISKVFANNSLGISIVSFVIVTVVSFGIICVLNKIPLVKRWFLSF
ncbi:MAG: acyltransferase family protein [Lachnospiraceae bacterium]|nr:acyltransferase family protein [Lachnospiraceae bacterium]